MSSLKSWLQMINLRRENKIVFMKAGDRVSPERDIGKAPAKSDPRVMIFCFGNIANFIHEIQSHDKVFELELAFKFFAVIHEPPLRTYLP